MEHRQINPWEWQNPLGFSQAIEVTAPSRILHCAGQAAVAADGSSQHIGDMRGQITLAMDNIEAVLKAAGYTLSNVVRLNYYTTNVQQFFEAYEVVLTRLTAAKVQPAATLLGIAALARPELMIEIEATAMK